MAEKKGIPWLLLAGLAALVYLLIRGKRDETPSTYPYPVSTTTASISPSAGVPMSLSTTTPAPTPVAPTPVTPTPVTPRPTPEQRRHPLPDPRHAPEWPPMPRPIPNQPIPRPIPPPEHRPGDVYRLPMQSPETPTVQASRVLGHPASVYPVYISSGELVGYRSSSQTGLPWVRR